MRSSYFVFFCLFFFLGCFPFTEGASYPTGYSTDSSAHLTHSLLALVHPKTDRNTNKNVIRFFDNNRTQIKQTNNTIERYTFHFYSSKSDLLLLLLCFFVMCVRVRFVCTLSVYCWQSKRTVLSDFLFNFCWCHIHFFIYAVSFSFHVTYLVVFMRCVGVRRDLGGCYFSPLLLLLLFWFLANFIASVSGWGLQYGECMLFYLSAYFGFIMVQSNVINANKSNKETNNPKNTLREWKIKEMRAFIVIWFLCYGN